MFLGNKFCGHCGEAASSVEIVSGDKVGECPRCKRSLDSLSIGSTQVRECTRCGGFWTSVDTFESICADKERQSAVINFIGSKPGEIANQRPISYVPCPDCKQLMNRSNFARSSGVIIDLCKEHGVWFDSGELPRIIEFIDKGGLARSREKEMIELKNERDRLRDDQRRMSMMERRAGSQSYGETSSSGLGSIIRALFDII